MVSQIIDIFFAYCKGPVRAPIYHRLKSKVGRMTVRNDIRYWLKDISSQLAIAISKFSGNMPVGIGKFTSHLNPIFAAGCRRRRATAGWLCRDGERGRDILRRDSR